MKLPIPTEARRAVLNRALWDYLRTGLSYDEAEAIKHEAERKVELLLKDLMDQAKAKAGEA